MKTKILRTLTAAMLLFIPVLNFAQAPSLGTAADFVFFSTSGAVTHTGGISQITGNVGTNSGSSTGFGNVNGVMNDNNGASAQCATDLLAAYNQLNTTTPGFFPAPALGNDTLYAGVYSIPSAATLTSDLTLDAQGISTAVFIFQIQGSFSAAANSKIKLLNGAQACNVFWKVEGLVSLASGTTMRGTVIANNAGIDLYNGDTLEGRALSTTGAININGVMAFTPIGCGSPYLTGPAAPALGSTECYAIFSADGAVTNAGTSIVTGDVGTNVGLTTGFDSINVTGTIHPIPDVSTGACAADLLIVYDYLNLLPYDIELLYPAQFGRNLVLTPHTYRMNAACVFTDSLFLNARGNADAVFVIHINGALSTSTYSKVILTNGTQAKNVFWVVNGAVDISDYSIFRGTMVCNNGAINLTTGVTLDGRALATVGLVNTAAITAIMPTVPSGCIITGIPASETGSATEAISLYPNPFTTSIEVLINDDLQGVNFDFRLYNMLGEVVINTPITQQLSTLETGSLPSGIYYYTISNKNKIVQSGKLISSKEVF